MFLTLYVCVCVWMRLAILVGELERHGISAEEERILLSQEGLRGVLGCVEFDEREALDGAEVLAWRGVFGNVDVLNSAVRAEPLAQLEIGDGAGQVARDDGADAARVDLRLLRLRSVYLRSLRSLRHHLKAVIGGSDGCDESDGYCSRRCNRRHKLRNRNRSNRNRSNRNRQRHARDRHLVGPANGTRGAKELLELFRLCINIRVD